MPFPRSPSHLMLLLGNNFQPLLPPACTALLLVCRSCLPPSLPQAAVDMMRKVLNSVRMDGVVVIGEGEKDEAPMLYCGERIGDGR